MLLPELQRVAQSLGITGTARMRKGQLIAAIEERRQGGGSGQANPVGQDGGELRAASARGRRPAASHIETSDNSVQRGAPAGAGADRTFKQDAMESQTSTQPGLGGMTTTGIGETHAGDTGIGAGSLSGATETSAGSAAANGSPRDDAQPTSDGQRTDRRRRSTTRRDDAAEQPRAASNGQDRSDGQDREVSQGARDQGGREQGQP